MSVPVIERQEEEEHEQNMIWEPPSFHRMWTLPVAILQILLSVSHLIFNLILPGFYRPSPHSLETFSVMVYSQFALWFGFLITDQILHYAHKSSKLQGYIEFYIKTKNIRRAPFYVLCFGNNVLIVAVMIMHDACDMRPGCNKSFLKLDFLRGVLVFEGLVVLCLVVWYVRKLLKHNKGEFPPDLEREEFFRSIMDPVAEQGEPLREEMMEKQAEVINYLQILRDRLGKDIQDLQDQLNTDS